MRKTLLLATMLCMSLLTFAQPPMGMPGGFGAPANNATYKDINYAGDNLAAHNMDIYLPEDGKPTHKVVVVIYGSAWFSNNMKGAAYQSLGKPLTDAGFAVVCINHRSSGDARFPAQIHDVKAALRFLRANAATYHLDTSFVGITGFSSGGHLSALAGVTNDMKQRTVGKTTVDLEGTLGGNLNFSSSVDAVVDWFGPVDMAHMENCETTKDARSPEAALIGGAPADNPDLVALISPITYIEQAKSKLPRFLVFHGDADNVVPHCQGVFFSDALQKAGRLEKFVSVPGGQHGPVTFNEDTFRQMTEFFLKEASRKGKDVSQVQIEFVTPNIIHVVKGQPTKSLVVTAQPGNVQVTHQGNTWSSSALTVRQDANGILTFLTSKGKVLLREKDCDISGVRQTFTLDKDEAIYGLGTFQNGRMNRRGDSKRMEQSNLEDFQNVLQSIKGWGLYWENYSPTRFEDNAAGMSLTSEVGDGIDYYFMYGGSADGVIAQMRQLTGDVPMFPLWTYGFWQSKERYKTAAETESVVDQYRRLQVPLDGIIQDWQYWGSNYLWNAMDFLSEDFTNGKQMIQNVHRKHAHFMISIWASFGPMTKAFRELNEKGLLMPFETWPQSGLSHIWPPRRDYPSGVRVYDAFSPEARSIYWKNLKTLYDYDVDAWWMDSTDPDFFNPRESDYQHKVYGGTWRSQRNAFPLETVRGIYEAQRKESDKKRVFIMTRSSYAGQQHYGSNMWSGDVASSWDMLRKQVPAGLSFTLTGNPNFNTDIGGFFCSSYNTKGSGSAPRNPQFQELYVRWMQYGLFCPVFRSHGADAPREIWQFGQKGEPVYDAIEKTIRLRYRLIPYLYSTAWQVTTDNGSYLRPLFSDFAADKKVWNTTDEFIFGRSILAAPILNPQYTEEKIIKEDAMTGWDKKQLATDNGPLTINWNEQKTAKKYLPKGCDWYDFWTGQRLKGGQTVTLQTQLDRVPMFVRAGSILPLGPEMQYVGEKSWDNLEVRVYPGANGTFTLYEDEGDNYNYEKGVYTTITFEWNDRARTLTIGSRKGSYPGMLEKRQFNVILPDGRQQQVSYDGGSKTIKM